MAVITLPISFETSLQEALAAANATSLNQQGREEVIDCMDMVRVWREWFCCHCGNLLGIRHRSNPDDPPDIELLFYEKCVAVEHTRLQPPPLGWAEDIATEIDPSCCIAIPPVSGPQRTRNELMNIMLGIGFAWAETNREWAVIVEELFSTMKRKMRKLPHGGVICVVDRIHLFNSEFEDISRLAAQTVDSGEFGAFIPYTLILLRRDGPDQTRSALIRQPGAYRVPRVHPKKIHNRCRANAMTSLSTGSTLIWFLADLEAVAAHYAETTAWHFLLACFKACDLDIAEFLRNTPKEVQSKKQEIMRDAGELRERVLRQCDDVATARRKLRQALGNGGQQKVETPLHRTADARAVFKRAAIRANFRNDKLRPADLFDSLMEWIVQGPIEGKLTRVRGRTARHPSSVPSTRPTGWWPAKAGRRGAQGGRWRRTRREEGAETRARLLTPPTS
jgi:hypothetical protein